MMNTNLVLLESLDGDAIPIRFIDSDIGVTELSVTQQLPEGESLVKVLLVTEIRSLPTRDMPSLPPRTLFLFGPLLLLLLTFLLLALFRRSPSLTTRDLAFLRRHRQSLRRRRGLLLRAPFAIGCVGVIGGVAVGATDLCGGKTEAHDWGGWEIANSDSVAAEMDQMLSFISI